MRRSPRQTAVRARRRTVQPAARAKARKLAVSFEAGLAAEVEAAAQAESGGNVSAWLATAARRSLKNAVLRELVADLERETGPVTAEEMAQLDQVWPRG